MSKSNAKHAPKTWYRLDLSAIVYPTLQRRDFSSVYRLSVLLKDPVQPDILQQAVDIAMKTLSYLSFRNAERIFLALS